MLYDTLMDVSIMGKARRFMRAEVSSSRSNRPPWATNPSLSLCSRGKLVVVHVSLERYLGVSAPSLSCDELRLAVLKGSGAGPVEEMPYYPGTWAGGGD